ncbi:FAD-dependent oxidoreductase [Streptomyces sp. NPDC048182]|uniref:FAD-dependent oxidoreductase n=1 Tax=Streptomyces sp. NPDC048182 TaxID=3365507 RepID=UPI00371291D5
MHEHQADVVVVGAGIAGLAAAHRLTSAGVRTVVLEAAHGVGGRMTTEKVDGFRLDRIGHLLSTAHPELHRVPALDGLAVLPFAPGVLLHGEGRHHRVGAPAGTGGARGARGALHAVRALAGAPRPGPAGALPAARHPAPVLPGPGWTPGRVLGWAPGRIPGRAPARVPGRTPGWAPGRAPTGGSGGTPVGGSGGTPVGGSGGTPVGEPGRTPAGEPGRTPAWAPGRTSGRGTVGLASVPRARAAAPLGTAVDQARLGAALARLAHTPVERLLARPELPAARALAARGLPARTVDGFLRPLLAALLCDPDLTTSSRCADLALRAFASGRLGLSAGGAEALPQLLARTLPPGTVRTGVRAVSVATNAVTTAEHGVVRCRAVLVATDAGAAAELLPGLRVPDFHPVTVVHHTTDEPPATGAWLLLDADRGGPVAHTAVVSEVDPSRAPAGRALVSSTVLGPPPADVDTAVRGHLARLYGTPTARWETLAVHHTAEAVPVMRPPHDPRRPVRLLAGLYVCGDHRDTSTVQGALRSGRRASAAILADLGADRPMHTADPLPTAA